MITASLDGITVTVEIKKGMQMTWMKLSSLRRLKLVSMPLQRV